MPYRIVPVNIGTGAQFDPAFLAIAPNNRMPAILDTQPAGGGAPAVGVRVRRHPAVSRGEVRAAAARGPAGALSRCCSGCSGRWRAWGRWPVRTITSSATHPRSCRTRSRATSMRPTVCTASSTSASRTREFIAGAYSIADIACYPWIVPYERQGQKLEDFPHLKRWFESIRARAATVRAYEAGQGHQHRDHPHRGGEESALRPDRALKRHPMHAKANRALTAAAAAASALALLGAAAGCAPPPPLEMTVAGAAIRVQLDRADFSARRAARCSSGCGAAPRSWPPTTDSFPPDRLQLALEAHGGDGVHGGKTFANPDAYIRVGRGPRGHRRAAAGRLGAGA